MDPTTISNKRVLKRIAPLQLGKMLAVLYGAMGLLVVPIFVFAFFFGPSAEGASLPLAIGIGIGAAILMPLMYAIMGFVIGVVGAALYNFLAKRIGGIEVEVE